MTPSLFDVPTSEPRPKPAAPPKPPRVQEVGEGSNLPAGQKQTWYQWCSYAGCSHERRGRAWEAYLAGKKPSEFLSEDRPPSHPVDREQGK